MILPNSSRTSFFPLSWFTLHKMFHFHCSILSLLSFNRNWRSFLSSLTVARFKTLFMVSSRKSNRIRSSTNLLHSIEWLCSQHCLNSSFLGSVSAKYQQWSGETDVLSMMNHLRHVYCNPASSNACTTKSSNATFEPRYRTTLRSICSLIIQTLKTFSCRRWADFKDS